jgi:hypothetical protein
MKNKMKVPESSAIYHEQEQLAKLSAEWEVESSEVSESEESYEEFAEEEEEQQEDDDNDDDGVPDIGEMLGFRITGWYERKKSESLFSVSRLNLISSCLQVEKTFSCQSPFFT